jgi:hypothetical protein
MTSAATCHVYFPIRSHPHSNTTWGMKSWSLIDVFGWMKPWGGGVV